MREHPEAGARIVGGLPSSHTLLDDRAPPPRARGRPRLPVRSARQRDPGRGAHRRRLRRLRGDDAAAALPRLADARTTRSSSCAATPTPSSTPRSWRALVRRARCDGRTRADDYRHWRARATALPVAADGSQRARRAAAERGEPARHAAGSDAGSVRRRRRASHRATAAAIGPRGNFAPQRDFRATIPESGRSALRRVAGLRPSGCSLRY